MRVTLTLYILMCLVILIVADLGRLGTTFSAVTDAPLGDKVLHVLFAGGLALLVNAVALRQFPRGRWEALAIGTAIAVLVCTVEEATNLLTPHRACDLADLLANYLGILLIGLAPYAVFQPVEQEVAA